MDLPYQRILLTGGCGFIGSHLLRRLLHREPAVRLVNLDALTYAGNQKNVSDLATDRRYRFVQGRVEDATLVASLLAEERIDAIVHLAAETHVDRSLQGPGAFITTNVLGTQVLLQAALTAGCRRFLLVSTDEVYGPAPPGESFGEDAPLLPSSPYAASKAAAELLARSYHRTFGLDVVITRGCNTYGSHQHPEKLLPLAIINALEGLPIPIYGNGGQERDWIHVTDHCAALGAALAAGASGGIYNVGRGDPRPNLEVVGLLLAALGRGPELLRQVTDRPAHDRRYAMDSGRLQRETGWRPVTDLAVGLRETASWYAGNRQWWEEVRDAAYREYYWRQYGLEIQGKP